MKSSTNRRATRQRRDTVDRILDEWEAVGAPIDIRTFAAHSRIQRIARYIEKATERVAKRNGISRRDLVLLFALRRASKPLTPTRLLEEISITSGATARRIEQLEKRGFLVRRPVPGDARSVTLHLTPRGKRLLETEYRVHREPELQPFNRLSAKKFDALVELLRELLIDIEQHSDEKIGPVGPLK